MTSTFNYNSSCILIAIHCVFNSSDNKFSELLILQTSVAHSGNYTCTPSNAAPASTFVHVFNGKLMRKYSSAYIFQFHSFTVCFSLSLSLVFLIFFPSIRWWRRRRQRHSGENPFGLAAYGAGDSTVNSNHQSIYFKILLLHIATHCFIFDAFTSTTWHWISVDVHFCIWFNFCVWIFLLLFMIHPTNV